MAQARRWTRPGLDAVKIKVGKPDLADDVERVAAVREVIGPDRRLMIDANQRWDLDAAPTARSTPSRRSASTWIEEPLRADDIAGHARCAAASRPRSRSARTCTPSTASATFSTPAPRRRAAQRRARRRHHAVPRDRRARRRAGRGCRPAPAARHLRPARPGPARRDRVEEVEDAAFAALGCSPTPSPVAHRRRPGAHDRPTRARSALQSTTADAAASRPPDGGTMTTTAPATTDDRDRSTAASTRPRPLHASRSRRTVASTAAERSAWLAAVADALDAARRRARRRSPTSETAPRHRPPDGRGRPHAPGSCGCSPRPSCGGLLPRGDHRPRRPDDDAPAPRPAPHAASRSARSRSSVPRTSRSRSPSRAATPPRRSPPAAPSS